MNEQDVEPTESDRTDAPIDLHIFVTEAYRKLQLMANGARRNETKSMREHRRKPSLEIRFRRRRDTRSPLRFRSGLPMFAWLVSLASVFTHWHELPPVTC